MATRVASQVINSRDDHGTFTVRLDDQFIDEEKLPIRLRRIFKADKITLDWQMNRYIISNAPRALTPRDLIDLRQ